MITSVQAKLSAELTTSSWSTTGAFSPAQLYGVIVSFDLRPFSIVIKYHKDAFTLSDRAHSLIQLHFNCTPYDKLPVNPQGPEMATKKLLWCEPEP
jgi:hypothetical protein